VAGHAATDRHGWRLGKQKIAYSTKNERNPNFRDKFHLDKNIPINVDLWLVRSPYSRVRNKMRGMKVLANAFC
jgi:hypothetical protein